MDLRSFLPRYVGKDTFSFLEFAYELLSGTDVVFLKKAILYDWSLKVFPSYITSRSLSFNIFVISSTWAMSVESIAISKSYNCGVSEPRWIGSSRAPRLAPKASMLWSYMSSLWFSTKLIALPSPIIFGCYIEESTIIWTGSLEDFSKARSWCNGYTIQESFKIRVALQISLIL